MKVWTQGKVGKPKLIEDDGSISAKPLRGESARKQVKPRAGVFHNGSYGGDNPPAWENEEWKAKFWRK